MKQSIRAQCFEHFGYEATEELRRAALGFWPVAESIPERLKTLGELIRGDLLPKDQILEENGKIRIVMDYDPDFPWAMVQVYGLKPGDIRSFDT